MKYHIKESKLLLFSFLIIYFLSGLQFCLRQYDYRELQKKGIITTAKTTFIQKKFNADHFRLEYVTKDRRIISNIKKCGDENTFIKKYSNPKVIYLLNKPEKYWFVSDFLNYSAGWSIFFFFGPYGLIGTWVCYGILRIIKFFRIKQNRKDFMKQLINHKLVMFLILFACSNLLSCSKQPKQLSGKIETIEVNYVNWACDCADFIETKHLKPNSEFELEEENCIYIESSDQKMKIPENFFTEKHFEYGLKLTGQFYVDKGIPKSYKRKTPGKPEIAKVFRYDSFVLVKIIGEN